jgi:hypothetical protein
MFGHIGHITQYGSTPVPWSSVVATPQSSIQAEAQMSTENSARPSTPSVQSIPLSEAKLPAARSITSSCREMAPDRILQLGAVEVEQREQSHSRAGNGSNSGPGQRQAQQIPPTARMTLPPLPPLEQHTVLLPPLPPLEQHYSNGAAEPRLEPGHLVFVEPELPAPITEQWVADEARNGCSLRGAPCLPANVPANVNIQEPFRRLVFVLMPPRLRKHWSAATIVMPTAVSFESVPVDSVMSASIQAPLHVSRLSAAVVATPSSRPSIEADKSMHRHCAKGDAPITVVDLRNNQTAKSTRTACGSFEAHPAPLPSTISPPRSQKRSRSRSTSPSPPLSDFTATPADNHARSEEGVAQSYANGIDGRRSWEHMREDLQRALEVEVDCHRYARTLVRALFGGPGAQS